MPHTSDSTIKAITALRRLVVSSMRSARIGKKRMIRARFDASGTRMTKTLKRCSWAGEDPAMQHYHDTEWGVPLHDDRALFEFLVLEGAQAGLSWSTVLNKREAYRKAFDGFDIA